MERVGVVIVSPLNVRVSGDAQKRRTYCGSQKQKVLG